MCGMLSWERTMIPRAARRGTGSLPVGGGTPPCRGAATNLKERKRFFSSVRTEGSLALFGFGRSIARHHGIPRPHGQVARATTENESAEPRAPPIRYD